jgi:hypothetical protein
MVNGPKKHVWLATTEATAGYVRKGDTYVISLPMTLVKYPGRTIVLEIDPDTADAIGRDMVEAAKLANEKMGR